VTGSRRERLEDEFIARAPLPLLKRAAELVARLEPLGPRPGWFFDVSELDGSPRTRFRREIWRTFAERRLREPITVRWYDGLKLRLFLGNDLSKCIYVGGAFEPNEFAFLAGVLRPGMTFVDVGANEGVYTLFAARRLGSTGRVVAIEPSTREYDRLLQNIRLNRLRNVAPFRVAAGADSDEATLAVAAYGHEGQNTLGKTVANAKVETESIERVAVRTLDALLDEAAVERVDVIKVDAEGSEVAVLSGARATILRSRPLMQLEVTHDALESQGATVQELVRLLESFEYALWTFDAETGRLRPRRSGEEVSGNVVAAPRGWEPA
jgi:FkbM family methyltransferase